MATGFVQDRMIYTEVIAKLIPQTKQRLWIATADIKDMYVEQNGTMVPFLKILADLIGNVIEVTPRHRRNREFFALNECSTDGSQVNGFDAFELLAHGYGKSV